MEGPSTKTPSPDPYAPPKADINQNGVAGSMPHGLPDYYVLSLPLALILPVLTFGFFAIYWNYRQWEALKVSGEKVNPAGRAFFSVFFIHGLFRHIQKSRIASGLPVGGASSGMATAYVILILLSNASRRASVQSGFFIAVLLTFIGSVILLLAQADINDLARKTNRNTNTGMGVGGVILVVLGAAVLLKAAVSVGTP